MGAAGRGFENRHCGATPAGCKPEAAGAWTGGVALAGGSNSSVQSKNCSVGHLGLNLTARGKSLVTPWKMVVIGRSSVSTSSSSIELVATPELLVSWDITL